MRKFLLATVATLGTGGLIGTALAQTPAPTNALAGQVPMAPVGGPSYVNNNNNYQAAALPGPVANPTPGTIVIHVNGKVQTTFQSQWSSLDQRTFVAPAAGSAAANLGVNGTGVAKLAPYALDSFARIYMGGDAMAANGLRYGAAIELRQNFSGQISNNASSGASGYSSLSTTYVRRAFTYVAGESWGLLRVGQADGIIGIMDNGVTTNQFLINGFNGGDNQNVPGGGVPFFFLSGAGNEYDNVKVVYMSPQIAGFDFGFQWAPNTSNGYGISASNASIGAIPGSGIGTGLVCGTATSGCPSLSSGPGIQDGSRATNQTAVGLRYQGKFGDLGVYGYGVYEFSGTVNYTGLQTAAILGTTTTPGSKFNGKYNGLSFGSAGAALTYAGFTLGGNFIGGKLNGQLATQPQGGAPEFGYTVGLKYTAGPLTAGVVGEMAWYQGNVQLSGISQRRARGIAVGANYTVAPGFTVFTEYLWEDVYQSSNNFLTGAIGTAAGSGLNNNYKNQGFLIGNVVNF